MDLVLIICLILLIIFICVGGADIVFISPHPVVVTQPTPSSYTTNYSTAVQSSNGTHTSTGYGTSRSE